MTREIKRFFKQFTGRKTTKFSGKPFKSGFKVNTIKSIVVHDKTGLVAFTFEQDNSIVEFIKCQIL